MREPRSPTKFATLTPAETVLLDAVSAFGTIGKAAREIGIKPASARKAFQNARENLGAISTQDAIAKWRA